jgi:hypothetical protein
MYSLRMDLQLIRELSPLFPKTSFVTKAGDLVCGVGYYDAAAQ